MGGYDYFYERDPWYCYPDSNVLRNKLGITDGNLLEDKEAAITSIRAMELDSNPIKGDYDLEHLKRIHKHLFSDIYEWAGELRTVDIAKGNSFCPCANIESYSAQIFGELRSDDYLRNLDEDEFVEKLAYYLGEINVIHPFREGNGRAQRKFIEQLSIDAGHPLSFKSISREEMIVACDHAFSGYYGIMRTMIERCLLTHTQRPNDEMVPLDIIHEADASAIALECFSIPMEQGTWVNSQVADYLNRERRIIVELRLGFTGPSGHNREEISRRMETDIELAFDYFKNVRKRTCDGHDDSGMNAYIVYVMGVLSYMSLGTEGIARILSRMDFKQHEVSAVAICLTPTWMGPTMYSGTEVYYMDETAIDRSIFSKNTEFLKLRRARRCIDADSNRVE